MPPAQPTSTPVRSKMLQPDSSNQRRNERSVIGRIVTWSRLLGLVRKSHKLLQRLSANYFSFGLSFSLSD
jgi:hypothetical protein